MSKRTKILYVFCESVCFYESKYTPLEFFKNLSTPRKDYFPRSKFNFYLGDTELNSFCTNSNVS